LPPITSVPLLEEMGIERSMASRLMAIADYPRLVHSVHSLPPHWGTLYEMAKFPPERLGELITDGTFTISTTRAAAAEAEDAEEAVRSIRQPSTHGPR